MTDHVRGMPQQNVPIPPSRNQLIGSTGCLIVVLLGMGYCYKSCRDEAAERQAVEAREGSKMDARIVCEGFVKERLKTPSTAQVHVAGTTDEAVDNLGGGKWRVSGYYDSQNSFGAMLRGYYVCDVQHTGGDRYNLIVMSMR